MFKKIITAISGFFTKDAPVVEEAFTKATGLLNVIKTFMGSATGQTLEAIIELVLPGASTAIFTALNTFFEDFGIVTDAIQRSPADGAALGLNKVATFTGNSKILAMSNIAAIIAHAGSTSKGGDSTLQQAIVSTPVVYNPAVLDVNPVLSAVNQVSAAQIQEEQVDPNAPGA